MKTTQKYYYKLNECIENSTFLQIIKGLNDYNFQITISTELDVMNNCDITHETVEQIDEYHDILSCNDIYKNVGFIALEGLRIDHLTAIKDTKVVTFYNSVIHFKDGRKELSDIMMKSGLNPNHWLGNAT